MFVFESRHRRMLVGRISPGEDIVASFRALAEREGFRSGWIRATGTVEWVEIAHWDQDREALSKARHIPGPLTLIEMNGNLAYRVGSPYIQVQGSLSQEDGVGIRMVGGRITAASSIDVEFTLEIFEDIRLERDEDSSTGQSSFKGGEIQRGVIARGDRKVLPEKRNKPSSVMREFGGEEESKGEVPELEEETQPKADLAAFRAVASQPAMHVVKKSGGISWGDLVQASEDVAENAPSANKSAPPQARVFPGSSSVLKRPAAATENENEEMPKRGDWIEHRQFGMCLVEREEPDGGVLVRMNSGQRKSIRLEVMEVLPPRKDGDRKVFAVRPKKRA